jgi:hypothetical protein
VSVFDIVYQVMGERRPAERIDDMGGSSPPAGVRLAWIVGRIGVNPRGSAVEPSAPLDMGCIGSSRRRHNILWITQIAYLCFARGCDSGGGETPMADGR